MNMITRFNYQPVPKRDSSKDDVFYKCSYEKKIRVLSTQKDGSVDKYTEEHFWKKEKCSWQDFIKSYNLGSVCQQVMDHLTKGTPLVTAHTLPAGDYTQIEKGAEIKREMAEKGLTLDMIVNAVNEKLQAEKQVKQEKKDEKVEVKENA